MKTTLFTGHSLGGGYAWFVGRGLYSLVSGAAFRIFFFRRESCEIIMHSLKVHDQTQNYLLPALQEWIKQQKQQKRPTKQ